MRRLAAAMLARVPSPAASPSREATAHFGGRSELGAALAVANVASPFARGTAVGYRWGGATVGGRLGFR